MSAAPWRCGNCAVLNGGTETFCNMCGAPPPPPGEGRAEQAQSAPTSVSLSKIDCGECGAPVNIAESVGRGQVVCESCGSVIDLGSPDFAILTRRMANAHPPRSNIRVGLEGVFGGARYRVVGRLRYVDAEGWQWDEWFMVAPDGSIRYLEDDDDELVLLEPVTPKAPPPITELQSATTITIDDKRYLLEERSTAKVAYFEGQLPWKVTVDSEVSFADLVDANGDVISAEWTKRELEFYSGRQLAPEAVARRFQLPTLRGPIVSSAFAHDGDAAYSPYDYDDELTGDDAASGPGVVLAIIAIMLIALFALCSDGECGGGGGGYSGGHYSGGGGGFGK